MNACARAKVVILAALAAMALPLFGGSYSYSGMSWTDSVSPGQWTSRYADAKAYAKKNFVPMVVVWASPTCSYCKSFMSSVGGSSAVKKWAASRGYMMVIAVGTSANDRYGLTGSDASAAYNFATSGLSKLPCIGVWWPKKSGGEVKKNFTGRSGSMPVKSGSFSVQFMDSVDQLVGAYASVAPKLCTVTFSANGGSGLSESSRYVATGKSLGSLPTAKRTNYLLDGWFTAKTGGEQVSSSTKITGNVTFYAQWKKAVTLKLASSPSGAGTLFGDGTYLEGKEVSVRAKAKSGYIFSCWKQGKTVVSQSATYTHTLGSAATTLTACFVSKAQDLSSIALSVDGVSQSAEATATNAVPQGVRLEWPVVASALTAATPSVSGLPSGLKLVKDKATGKYTITGTPTAVSKADKNGNVKPSNVTLKVKTSGGSAKTYKMAIKVEARPEWTEGVFNGYAGTAKEPVGIVYNLTVAANGKVSGKLLREGKTYTLSAPALQLSGGKYSAAIEGKAGKEVKTFTAKFSEGTNGGYSYGALEAANEWTAIQTPWKANDKLKALAKKIAKAKPVAVPGALGDFGDATLKFGANGAVTVKGGGVSGSAVLIPDSEEPKALDLHFYLAPKKSFPGHADRIYLKWDGTNFSL